MLLYNTLNEIKSLLEESEIMSLSSSFDKKYPIQITPDERPFPITGDGVITLHGEQITRVNPDHQFKMYVVNFGVTVTRRTTRTPHDRNYIYL